MLDVSRPRGPFSLFEAKPEAEPEVLEPVLTPAPQVPVTAAAVEPASPPVVATPPAGSGSVLRLTGRPVRPLPLGRVGTWGRVWWDRVTRRKPIRRIPAFIAVLAALLALMVLSYTWLGLSDQLRVRLSYSYVLSSGVCLAIAQPMRQALIANTVPPEAFGNAYAANSLSITGTRIFGPFGGGILIASLGFTANFLVEAALYAAAVLVSRKRARKANTAMV